MNADVLFFFSQHMGVLPFYKALETRVTFEESLEQLIRKLSENSIL